MNNHIDCDEDIHEYFILEGYIQCVFCNKKITGPSIADNYCCENQKLNNDNTCINCGTVYYPKYVNDEYINVHENKYKIKTKSIYFRKYHINNVLSQIIKENKIKIQLIHENKNKIINIFELINDVLPKMNNHNQKRLISVKFIIQKICQTFYINMPITKMPKCKKTLEYYNNCWNEVLDLIRDKIINK